jgi:putative acetyltransferase
VFGDNDPAIKLYRRFGFEIEGRHQDFVRRGENFVDGYTMARLNIAGVRRPDAA